VQNAKTPERNWARGLCVGGAGVGPSRSFQGPGSCRVPRERCAPGGGGTVGQGWLRRRGCVASLGGVTLGVGGALLNRGPAGRALVGVHRRGGVRELGFRILVLVPPRQDCTRCDFENVTERVGGGRGDIFGVSPRSTSLSKVCFSDETSQIDGVRPLPALQKKRA